MARQGAATTVAPRAPGASGPDPRSPTAPTPGPGTTSSRAAPTCPASPGARGPARPCARSCAPCPTPTWATATPAATHAARGAGGLPRPGAGRGHRRRPPRGLLGLEPGPRPDLPGALATRGVTAIGMEDPCIPHYRATVRAAGLEVVPLPVDEDGARLGRPRRGGRHRPHPGPPVPVGADPGARAAGRRRGLGPGHRRAWSWRTTTTASCAMTASPSGALQALDPEHVVYVGTAAKSLAPGLRLAWMAVPSTLRDDLWEVKHLADRHTLGAGAADPGRAGRPRGPTTVSSAGPGSATAAAGTPSSTPWPTPVPHLDALGHRRGPPRGPRPRRPTRGSLWSTVSLAREVRVGALGPSFHATGPAVPASSSATARPPSTPSPPPSRPS